MATLTGRGRKTRALAFSRRTQRMHEAGGMPKPPVRDVVIRSSHGHLVMPLEAFSEMDHVQLCQRLGLYHSMVVGGRPERASR